MSQPQFNAQDEKLVQDYLDANNGRRGVDPVEVAVDLGLGVKNVQQVHIILEHLVKKKKAYLETVDQMPLYTTSKVPFQKTGRTREDIGVPTAPAAIIIK